MIFQDAMRNKDYRRDELHPEVAALFDYVRTERRKEVPTYAIDKAILLQEQRSVYTACNYIRYFLLHELRWIDVFGEEARRYDKQLEHYKQCVDLEKKVDELQRTVNDMSDQMEKMQTMLINIAKILNKYNIKCTPLTDRRALSDRKTG